MKTLEDRLKTEKNAYEALNKDYNITKEQNKQNQNKIKYLEDDINKLKENKNKEFEELLNKNKIIENNYQISINEKDNLDKINKEYKAQLEEERKQKEELNNIVKENAFEKHKQDIIDKTNERNELKNNVDILETYVKLNRIAKTNFKSLSKGINRENERLTFQSEKANRESHYLNQLMPEIRKEVDDMKREIEYRHEETKNLNNEKMLIQKELSHLHDEIKKYNWLNTETFNQKEKIKK